MFRLKADAYAIVKDQKAHTMTHSDLYHCNIGHYPYIVRVNSLKSSLFVIYKDD